MKVLGNYKLEIEDGREYDLSFSINMLRAFRELYDGVDLEKASLEVNKLAKDDLKEYHYQYGLLICDIVFCAAYAYCEEEGLEPNFTRAKILKDVSELSEEKKRDLIDFMSFNNTDPTAKKEKAAQVKSKNL